MTDKPFNLCTCFREPCICIQTWGDFTRPADKPKERFAQYSGSDVVFTDQHKYPELKPFYYTKPHDESAEKNKWECFLDRGYYDFWRVRRISERAFTEGFSIVNGEEAEALCKLLNDNNVP